MGFSWLKDKSSLERNRLYILIGGAVVLGAWSMMSPVIEPIDSMDLPKVSPPTTLKQFELASVSNFDPKSWDLPATIPKVDKPVTKPIVHQPPPFRPPIFVPPPAPQPIVAPIQRPTVPAVRFTYLGQVTDSQKKTQVFLSIDDDPVVMRPGRIYDSVWRLVSMDAYQVKVEHIPSHQIIAIPKGQE